MQHHQQQHLSTEAHHHGRQLNGILSNIILFTGSRLILPTDRVFRCCLVELIVNLQHCTARFSLKSHCCIIISDHYDARRLEQEMRSRSELS